MSSELVAWLTSFIWLIAILGLWWTSLKQYERIRAQEQLIRNIYEKNNTPGLQHDPQSYLKLLTRLGWERVSFETRRDILSSLRAEAQADKQKLATYIEMMPQMGLLGTVLSLFLSAFFFDFNMKMLGMALATTAFGLVGSLVARNWFELPSERHFYGILAMLEDEQVTKELLALHQEHIPTKTNTPNELIATTDDTETNTVLATTDPAETNTVLATTDDTEMNTMIATTDPAETNTMLEANVTIENTTPTEIIASIEDSVPTETIVSGETITSEEIVVAPPFSIFSESTTPSAIVPPPELITSSDTNVPLENNVFPETAAPTQLLSFLENKVDTGETKDADVTKVGNEHADGADEKGAGSHAPLQD